MRNFRKTLSSASVLLFVVCATSSAQAQYCMVADWAWQAGHDQTQTQLQARVDLLGSNLAQARALTLQTLLSAAKVVTKQAAVNSDRTTTAQFSTQQAMASTLTQQQRNDATIKAVETYSAETGQGVKPCQAISLSVDTVEALENVPLVGKRLYTDIDVGPGKATSIHDAVTTRLANSQKTDAAVFLTPSASDSDRQALIQQLAGLPMPLPSASAPMSGAEADETMLRARRVEALRSPALVSLSMVRAMSNSQGHEFGTTGVAPLDQLDNFIAQYGGGPNFNQWSAALAGQSEHGLLIELARLRSISLKLRQTLSDQNARTTALFATMLAASNGDL